MTQKQLKEWIEQMGGRNKAAAHLGINTSTLWRWVKNPRKINKISSMAIESQMEIHP